MAAANLCQFVKRIKLNPMKNSTPKYFKLMPALLFVFLLTCGAFDALGETSLERNVKENCAAKWSEDYKMQKHCREKQFNALDSMRVHLNKFPEGTEENNILNRCMGKWGITPGEEDYNMVMYCTKKQLEAYQELYPSDSPSSTELHRVPTSPPEVSSEIGEKIYHGKGICAPCHGEAGDGPGPAGKVLNPPPTNFRTSPFLQEKTDEGLFKIIKSGIPGTGMVAMNHLSDEEIWHLIAYIREINQE